MGRPIIATKLYASKTLRGLVARPKLTERLRTSRRARSGAPGTALLGCRVRAHAARYRMAIFGGSKGEAPPDAVEQLNLDRIRLVGALLVEINDEMIAAERRYISAASVAELTNDPSELALPAAPRT